MVDEPCPSKYSTRNTLYVYMTVQIFSVTTRELSIKHYRFQLPWVLESISPRTAAKFLACCCRWCSPCCSGCMEGAIRSLSFSIIKILGTEKTVICSEESSLCTTTKTGTTSQVEDERCPPDSDCLSCIDLELDSRGEPGNLSYRDCELYQQILQYFMLTLCLNKQSKGEQK